MEELYRTIEETIKTSGCPFLPTEKRFTMKSATKSKTGNRVPTSFSLRRRMIHFLNTDFRFLRTTLT